MSSTFELPEEPPECVRERARWLRARTLEMVQRDDMRRLRRQVPHFAEESVG
jgi:hypothetical protein